MSSTKHRSLTIIHHLLDSDAFYSSGLGGSDGELQILVIETLVDFGNITQAREDEAAHGLVVFVFRQVKLKLIVEVVNVCSGIDFDSVLVYFLYGFGRRFFILIDYLADELFENIL